MKHKLMLATLALAFCCTISSGADDTDSSGATLGKWTQDLAAAKKLAKEKDLPMLINFSGSDWCGWCKLMERDVFSKDEWLEYAKKNILMVKIDFPKNKSIVPKKFIERNEELKDKFGVRGFPTFIILDSDGETELGRLSAGRDQTPEIFINSLSGLFRYRAAEVKKYTSKMNDKDKAAYLEIVSRIQNSEKGIKDAKAQISAAEKKIEEMEEDSENFKKEASEFRAAHLGPEKLKEYKQLKADLDKAVEEMKSWMATEPERTRVNMQKAQSMAKGIEELETKLGAF